MLFFAPASQKASPHDKQKQELQINNLELLAGGKAEMNFWDPIAEAPN